MLKKFQPDSAHLLMSWYESDDYVGIQKLVAVYSTNAILKQKQNALKEAQLQKGRELKAERDREANMTPQEKRQMQRQKLVDAILNADKDCPPIKRELSGMQSYSFITLAKHTPTQVLELYPNLQGHNFMPMQSEFGIIDINYLISKVVSDETRQFILQHSTLPQKAGLFTSVGGHQARCGNPASLTMAGIKFERQDLYRASHDAEDIRQIAQQHLADFDSSCLL
jgi:hypothetical protein